VDADLFDELMKRPWTYVPGHAPSHSRRDGTPRQLHRFIMGVRDPRIQVDHRDGNTLDNRRKKLRVATCAQNVRNARKKSNARTSTFKGVHRSSKTTSPKPWQAMIRANKRHKFLGCFATEKEAACAYDDAAREYFGAFACVNFPREGERSAI
jgi:hypothetical protein